MVVLLWYCIQAKSTFCGRLKSILFETTARIDVIRAVGARMQKRDYFLYFKGFSGVPGMRQRGARSGFRRAWDAPALNAGGKVI
jgi:hypothetical protein